MMGEAKILQLFGSHTGAWMPRPADWVWVTPAKQAQGFGLSWRDNVGLANLQWLCMAMDTPPSRSYNWRCHNLLTIVTMYGDKMEVGGQPLFNQAEALTLAQFRNILRDTGFSAPAPYNHIDQLLLLLANERLEHAHT